MRILGLRGRVLATEVAAFALVIALLWVDETCDFPAVVLGTHRTPVNWPESLFETAAVLALGGATLWGTRRVLARIRILEGFLPACAVCKRIRRGSRWVPLEEFILDHTEARMTHGLCPECLEREYGYVPQGGESKEREE